MSKQKFLSVFCVLLVLFACKSKVKEEQKLAKSTPEKKCFLAALNQDTVKMQLEFSDTSITGSLLYLPYEKDAREGILYKGKLSGDTLFAQYQSTQEGMESICELALLKSGDRYVLTNDIWGGDNFQYNEQYTIGKFIDKSKIRFDGDTLKEIVCP